MSAAAPWTAYAGQDEQGPWSKYASAPQPPKKSVNEQLTETRPWPQYDPEHPIASAGRAALTGLGNYGGHVISGVEGLANIPHMLMHPIDAITKDIPEGAINMGREIEEGHPEAAAGDVTGMYLGGKALGSIPKVGAANDAIGRFTRDRPLEPVYEGQRVGPGKLKPWVNTTSKIGGAGAGYLAGEALGGPYGGYGGGALGYKIGSGLADMILPKNPDVISRTKVGSGGIPPVGSAAQEAGYYPPVTKVPIRSEPPYKLTPESVPGPDTAGKGNLLTPLAKIGGDPRAASELMRRGRKVLYVPAEEYPEPRSRETF